MAVIKWQPAYACGVTAIDYEHRELVRMVNGIYEAIRADITEGVLPAIVEELIDYTVEHFAHEEELMREAGYPDLAAHEKLHRQLESTVQLTRQRLASGEQGMGMEIFNFLRHWLLDHIVETDLPAGHFIRNSGRH